MTILITTLILLCYPLTLGEETPEPPSLPKATSFRMEMIHQVNTLRKNGCRCGDEYFPPAPPLHWDIRLERAAQRHVRDMALHFHFDHTGTDGSSTAERVQAAGYRYRLLGENIAYGHPSLQSVFDDWLKSPGHCRNMMNPAYSEIGAAKEDRFWVQTLGRKR
jgi:uncharacterized protein YkwD